MQVHLYGLRVEVASHLCRSLSIIVCSDALEIWDASDEPKTAGHDRKISAVISIGHQQAVPASSTGRLLHVNSLSLSKSKTVSGHHSMVRGGFHRVLMCICRPHHNAAIHPTM